MLAVLRCSWVFKEIYVEVLLNCVEFICPLNRDYDINDFQQAEQGLHRENNFLTLLPLTTTSPNVTEYKPKFYLKRNSCIDFPTVFYTVFLFVKNHGKIHWMHILDILDREEIISTFLSFQTSV